MRVSVLVPRRAGDPHRDHVWAWVRRWWQTNLPDLPAPTTGEHDDGGPFNRSAALNAAAHAAGAWDVAVIADADSIVDPANIRAAIERADDSQRMVIAYEVFAHLNQLMTQRVRAGYSGPWEYGVDWTLTGTFSSMIAVPRALWDQVGGFDVRFVGWGMEDVAFATAAKTLGDGLERLPGTLWHLWHEPAQRQADLEAANVALLQHYADAAGDPDAMRAVCQSARLART
jgi:hypothetical protein